MKVVKKLIAASVAMLLLVVPAAAQEGVSPQGILAIGKMTGACGIMNSMIQVQESTRMEGGEAFLLRFWEVEAARLGMSLEELSGKCNQSISAYDALWSAAESME